MLHVPFALFRREDICIGFDINETREAVPLGEPVGDALPMFPRAFRNLRRRTDVKSAVRAVGHDVKPSGWHAMIMTKAEYVRQSRRGWPGQARPRTPYLDFQVHFDFQVRA
jgi:hypothetical protein